MPEASREPGPVRRCAACAHFRGDAAAIERAFPGLSALSSGSASVRAYDGLCLRLGVYLAHSECCDRFEPAVLAGPARRNAHASPA